MAKNTENQTQEQTPEERVRVILPRSIYKGDEYLFVGLNGKGYLIKRGVAVMVPRGVADVIDETLRQQERQERYQDELEQKFRSAMQMGAI